MVDNRSRQSSDRDERNAQALVTVQPPRLPMPAEYTDGIGKWKVLIDSIYPSAKSVDGVLLAVRYCESRKLDVMKRPVHVVPIWSTKLGREVESVWPGIGEIRITASRTGVYAGIDDCAFGPMKTMPFKDKATRGSGDKKFVVEAQCEAVTFPEWAQITVYKIVGGVRCAFVGPRVEWLEIFSGEKALRVPNERWRRAPKSQLEKCCEAAALRRAFPEELGNVYAAEEMEGRAMDVPEGEYAVVDREEAEKAANKRPEREKEEGLGDWTRQELDDYVILLQEGFASTKSEAAINRARAKEDKFIDTLPSAERKLVEAAIDKAMSRLAVEQAERDRKAAKAAPQEGKEPSEGADGAPEGGNNPEAPEPPSEPRYIVNLRKLLAEITTIEDLDGFETDEKPYIAGMAADEQDMARDVIQHHRDTLSSQ